MASHSTVRALLEEDASTPMADTELDGQIWRLLCKRIDEPKDVRALPPEVGIYYASRLVQWEVGNGGFAQAAYSCPNWLLPAAQAYEVLGRPEFAALVREAQALVPANPDDLEHVEQDFEALDERLAELEWEVDADRIAYVRTHASAFASV